MLQPTVSTLTPIQHHSQALKFKAKPLKSQPEAKDIKAAQNNLEEKAIRERSIAFSSKNPDAINEPMYCKYKYVEL
jgi:hypothetical protein